MSMYLIIKEHDLANPSQRSFIVIQVQRYTHDPSRCMYQHDFIDMENRSVNLAYEGIDSWKVVTEVSLVAEIDDAQKWVDATKGQPKPLEDDKLSWIRRASIIGKDPRLAWDALASIRVLSSPLSTANDFQREKDWIQRHEPAES